MSTVRIPYFDDAEVGLDEEELGRSDPGAAAALAAFLSLIPEDRISDSRHVYAYYRDVHEAVGGEDWLDEEMGVPETESDIWTYVTPGTVYLARGRNGDDLYVVMEAGCEWEAEHGLMLVWRNGTTLCKVGGYDGHLTNANAYADPSLADVVYKASDSKYTTRLEE